ncbi:response regulator transcription factor [Rothia halotolerans]|uniref:response regulator transcription factor n=1 Tax=Rothia halotolerans TaxID=405770 RepID=UPI00101D61F2|nr:response regulator [Rothia halotolerans]
MAAETPTALIIEDDDDIRRLLEIVLQQSGFEVGSAVDGATGLEAAREAGAGTAIITVDVGLPDIDGYEVVRRIRPEFGGLIVMISARSTDADRAAGLAAGADAYLTKPFRPRELRASIAEILGADRGDGALPDTLQGGHE